LAATGGYFLHGSQGQQKLPCRWIESPLASSLLYMGSTVIGMCGGNSDKRPFSTPMKYMAITKNPWFRMPQMVRRIYQFWLPSDVEAER
jgi:hypothetical protein